MAESLTSDLISRLRELADECEAVAKERAQTEGGDLHYMNTCDWVYAAAFRGAANEIEKLREQRTQARVLLHDVSESTLPDRIHEFLKRTKERP